MAWRAGNRGGRNSHVLPTCRVICPLTIALHVREMRLANHDLGMTIAPVSEFHPHQYEYGVLRRNIMINFGRLARIGRISYPIDLGFMNEGSESHVTTNVR